MRVTKYVDCISIGCTNGITTGRKGNGKDRAVRTVPVCSYVALEA